MSTVQLYIMKYLMEKQRQKLFYKQAVETNGGNCPGYPMNKTDIGFKKIVDQEVTGEQYVVFRFNINDKELTDWVISKISDVEKKCQLRQNQRQQQW